MTPAAAIPARSVACAAVRVRARLLAILLTLGASIEPGASALAQTPVERPVHAAYGLFFGLDRWNDATHLIPSLAAFPEIRTWEGRMKASGYGLGFHYEHVVRRMPHADLFLGGELGAFANTNPKKSFSGVDAATGQIIRVSLGAAVNYLTANVRWVSRPRGGLALNAGLGAGPYLFFPREVIDRIGEVETNDAWTGGGFLAAGLDQFAHRRRYSFRLEARVHEFAFRNLTRAFPGQRVSGPLITIEFGFLGWN